MKKKGLTGRVALVAGATRGAGRGIARALGEAGAVVYCTGRSVREIRRRNTLETIDETAEMINAAGGTAIASESITRLNQRSSALLGRIDREHGRLDVLVISIAGEEPMMSQYNSFWKTNLKDGEAVFRQALLSHIITAKHAVPLMIRARRGLIVEVTENDILAAGGNPCRRASSSLKGLAFNMAAELKPHGVAAVAVTPGFLRSEAMLEHFGCHGSQLARRREEGPELSRVGVALSLAVLSPRWRRTVVSSILRVSCAARGSSRASTVSTTPTAAGRTGARSTSIARGFRRSCWS
jgi:NAD(P)-dependent dehydrogenase (short-subunit alcohol dehydrogenase family)